MIKSLLTTFATVLLFSQAQAQSEKSPEPQIALLKVAAARLDSALSSVAQSIVAVGKEFQLRLEEKHPTPTEDEIAYWQSAARTKGKTTEFTTHKGDHLAFQAAYPSFYAYDVTPLEADERTNQLQALWDTTPVVRAAYNSFDYSWVYITTADNVMLVYPYLTMNEAVHNYPPTGQVFYTCAASLSSGYTGWSPPYLDLVGAGLMVTVSTPVYAHNKLSAVASRDITLQQLTASILKPMVQDTNAIAYIVDRNGLAIDSTSEAMNAEIDSVNTANESAALYYLPKNSLKEAQDATSSSFDFVNKVTMQVLAANADSLVHTTIENHAVYAVAIPQTDWRLIMIHPHH